MYVLFFSTIMVGFGLLLEVGDFELDLTSYLFYNFITVVSTILLYHMHGRRFLVCFFSALISEGVRI